MLFLLTHRKWKSLHSHTLKHVYHNVWWEKGFEVFLSNYNRDLLRKGLFYLKLKDLIDKDVRIEFNTEDTSDVVGTLNDIDTETNVIHVHVHYNNEELLIPLNSIKNISEQF
jgi:small nuclear ribonucleoprotein (snRNP)-like protein